MSNEDDGEHIDWSRKDEPEMRARIVKEYYSFAVAMARRKVKKLPSSVDGHSLEAAAVDALIKSIDRFKPQRGYAFLTYVSHRIRGAMLDALRNADHLSRTARSIERRYHASEESLSHQLSRSPTTDEVLADAGLDSEQMTRVVGHSQDIDSEYSRGHETGKSSRHDRTRSRKSDPDTELFRSEAFRHLARGLDMEEQTILYLYYYRQATMKTIGVAMGISESRVCQIHSTVLLRIRRLGKDRLLG